MIRPSQLLCVSTACCLLLLALLPLCCSAQQLQPLPIPPARPAPSARKFVSPAVDSLISNFSSRFVSADLSALFSNCLPNTLDTTVFSFQPESPQGGPRSFVITGDIPAQWFRDSANQLLPYLPLIAADSALGGALGALTCGLILRHADDVSHDSFANAFNFNASGAGHQTDFRRPPMTPQVFEGKYELDSLAAVMKLANRYYAATGDDECFLKRVNWMQAMETIVATIASMSADVLTPDQSPYLFQRVSSIPTESENFGGMGWPTRGRTGMSRSPFRPSDDATTLPFLIPAQAMAVVELRALGAMLEDFLQRDEESGEPLQSEQRARMQTLAQNATALAQQINTGIQTYGLTPSDEEIAWSLSALLVSSAGTGFLHESFDADDPTQFTRPWFAWVNGLFGELIMKIAEERPHLIFKQERDEYQQRASLQEAEM